MVTTDSTGVFFDDVSESSSPDFETNVVLYTKVEPETVAVMIAVVRLAVGVVDGEGDGGMTATPLIMLPPLAWLPPESPVLMVE